MMRLFTILLVISLGSCMNPQSGNVNSTQQKSQIKLVTSSIFEAAEKNGDMQKDKLTSKSIFKYDENGNLTEANYYDLKTNLIFSKDKRAYDNKGNMIEITFYNQAGEIVGKDIYLYDNKNNQTQKDNYWKGKLNGKLTRTYDYDSMVVTESSFDENGNLQTKFSYKIDDKGNHLKEYDMGGNLISESKYEYDEKGKIIKEISEAWELDTTKNVIVYEYDIQNNEVLRKIKDLKNDIESSVKTEYVYDKFGNWTKKITTWSWTSTIQTEKREIEYYEE